MLGFAAERALMDEHGGDVAGVDEVGRGPLAGPVVAAAVILDPDAVPDGLADSKALLAGARERLSGLILATARSVSIASVGPARIDRLNIRQATLAAMAEAIAGLALAPRLVLVDGRDLPPLPAGVRGQAVVGGDATWASIAAASIVAKVHRDRLMSRLAAAEPGYGFERHKGYGAAAHLEAIARLGPCAHHRMTFGRLKGA